jgi:hypothetical protein
MLRAMDNMGEPPAAADTGASASAARMAVQAGLL